MSLLSPGLSSYHGRLAQQQNHSTVNQYVSSYNHHMVHVFRTDFHGSDSDGEVMMAEIGGWLVVLKTMWHRLSMCVGCSATYNSLGKQGWQHRWTASFVV